MLKYLHGDNMVNQEHVEKLYDCFDQSATLLYEKEHLTFLDGLVKTCENILANSVEVEDEVLRTDLLKLINEISEIEFSKEEIRKAFQYACLKGMKHQNISNQMITPESIGFFFSYLVEKLYLKKTLLIFDPLIGVGNLITSLANNLNKEVNLVGVDNDFDFYKLAQALLGMLEYGDKIFYQDTLTFKNIKADLIVTDFSAIEQNNIYEIIKHQDTILNEDAFLISVIDNSFFDNENITNFINEVKNSMHFFGMIILPKVLFKNNQKSIFILQKIGKDFIKPSKFLFAELPDLNNKSEMTRVIDQLNNWFEKIDFYRVRENNE